MQLKIEDVSPVEKKLVVEFPWVNVEPKLDQALAELARNVNLKGFRQGKAPKNVVEQMFGKRVRNEVAMELVREAFLSAVSQHKLAAVAEPKLPTAPVLSKGKPFTFEAVVEVRGDFSVNDFDGLALGRRPINVAEDAVDAAVKHMQREHTELVPIEGRTELSADDVAAISIRGQLGDLNIDRPEILFDLGDDENEPLPGLNAAMKGMAIDSKDVTIKIVVPGDYKEAKFAGQEGSFVISVLDARRKDTPKLDDDFAKDTGKAQSMDELRTVLRSEIQKRLEQEVHGELRNEALKELVKKNQIPVAESLVERAVMNRFLRLQRAMGVQKPDPKYLTPEIRESLRVVGADEVRGQLLLEALAEKLGIAVEEEELQKEVVRIAESSKNTNAGRLRAEMERDGRLDDIRFSLRQDKTLDYLVNKAVITERVPEPEAAAGAPAATQAK